MYSEAGWGAYPDSQEVMGALYQQISGLAYTPDLGPVGHASAYYPRDTSADAAALNFLGFYPDALLQRHVGTTGTQSGDMSQQAGAWDPSFQTAVRDFQELFGNGLGVDGWIGPSTRSALKQAVDAKNQRDSPIAPPQVIPPVTPPGVSPNPSPGSPAQPVSAVGGMSTTTLAVIGLAAVAGAYAVYRYVL